MLCSIYTTTSTSVLRSDVKVAVVVNCLKCSSSWCCYFLPFFYPAKALILHSFLSFSVHHIPSFLLPTTTKTTFLFKALYASNVQHASFLYQASFEFPVFGFGFGLLFFLTVNYKFPGKLKKKYKKKEEI